MKTTTEFGKPVGVDDTKLLPLLRSLHEVYNGGWKNDPALGLKGWFQQDARKSNLQAKDDFCSGEQDARDGFAAAGMFSARKSDPRLSRAMTYVS